MEKQNIMFRSPGAGVACSLCSVAVAVVLATTSVSLADIFSWSNASDSNGVFSWSNGRNEGVANLYQDPFVSTVGFAFTQPVDFKAVGGGGVGDSKTNVAKVDLVAQSMGLIGQIRVWEWGAWTAGPLDDLDTVFTLQADVTYLQPIFGPGASTQHDIDDDFFEWTLVSTDPDGTRHGTWFSEGTLVSDFGPSPFGFVNVTNTLQVSSSAAAGSSFEKLGMQMVIPEPGSILFLLLGTAPLALRRRFSRK